MAWTDDHAAAESILFAAGEPVPLERLAHALELSQEETAALCRELGEDLEERGRGVRVIRLEDCFQMVAAPRWGERVRRVLAPRKPAKLSAAALEVLTVVAYYQPVTRAYIDQLRGVDSAYTVALLQERELIEECGRLEAPGRPILYQTTVAFLRTFGLESLADLPPLPAAPPVPAPEGEEGGGL